MANIRVKPLRIYRDLAVATTDEKLSKLIHNIVCSHVEGISTDDISRMLLKQLTPDLIDGIVKIISKTIDNMAISAEVKYDGHKEIIVCDFRIEEESLIFGKIVEIELEDILFYKTTYRKTLADSFVATLIYNHFQKPVVGKSCVSEVIWLWY